MLAGFIHLYGKDAPTKVVRRALKLQHVHSVARSTETQHVSVFGVNMRACNNHTSRGGEHIFTSSLSCKPRPLAVWWFCLLANTAFVD
jgi:hypothetical protein